MILKEISGGGAEVKMGLVNSAPKFSFFGKFPKKEIFLFRKFFLFGKFPPKTAIFHKKFSVVSFGNPLCL